MRLCSIVHSCFVFFSCRTSPITFASLHKKDEDKSESDEDDEESLNGTQQFKPFHYTMNR
jgi:hypothetical protein